MNVKDFLIQKTSYQERAWTNIVKELTIEEVIHEIRIGKYKNRITQLRSLLENGKAEEYDFQKKLLPAVTFCATFNGFRRKDYLLNYNHLLVIDIDKLNNDEHIRTKEILSKEAYVFSFWDSPSRKGFKGLISISYENSITKLNVDILHYEAFKIIALYFLEKYKIILDPGGNDTTRLCFLSYDPELILKEEMTTFIIPQIKSFPSSIKKAQPSIALLNTRDSLYNPKNRNRPLDKFQMEAILRFLKANKLSITNTYSDWIRVAYAIANSFTFDLGERYFLRLSQLDIEKYDEDNCKNLLKYCYHKTMHKSTFQSILFLAKQKGLNIKENKGGVP